MLNYCPQCGATRAPDAAYCGQCGRAFEPGAEAATPTPPPAPASPWSGQADTPPGADSPPSGAPYATEPPAYSWTPPPAYPAAHMPVARVSKTLGTWIQVLGGIAAGMYAIVALIAVATRGAMEDLVDNPFELGALQDYEDLDDALSGVRALASLLVLAIVILLIIWLFQLTRSVGRHGVPQRRWSPGWAVGGWFIPLANFVIPWLIFREGEKISVAAASGRTSEWAQAPVRLTSNLWWIAVIVGEVLLLVGGGMYSDDTSDLDEVRTGLTLITIGALLLVVGYALLIPVIRRITRYDNAPDPIVAG